MALPTQMIGGLISGMDTNNIIEQLMSIERSSVKRLENKRAELELQLEGYRSVNSLLLEYSSAATSLADDSIWKTKTAASSNESVVSVSALDTAITGSHMVKVARTATNSKFMSGGFSSMENPILPEGTGTRQVDGDVLATTLLADINQGAGITNLGYIDITRGAVTANVDLSACETIGDVQQAIFQQSKDQGLDGVNSLVLADGTLRIVDTSGSADDLVFTDNGASTSATDLGLTALMKVSETATSKTYETHIVPPLVDEAIPGNITVENSKGRALRNTEVKNLNGGAGIYHGGIRILNAAGERTEIDLSSCETLNDIVNTINSTDGTGIMASVDDNGLVLTDVSGGAGTLVVQNMGLGTTADDLGLTSLTDNGDGTYSGTNINQLTGSSVLGMLRDGRGINDGDAGDLLIVKDGTEFTVDLSNASNLNDIMSAMRKAKDEDGNLITGLSVSLQDNRLVAETTDGGTMTISSVLTDDAGNSTAEDLGLATGDTAIGKVQGRRLVGDLNSVQIDSLMGQKSFSRESKLSDFGIAAGEDFTITDKLGNVVTFTADAESTLGDMMDVLNDKGDAAEILFYIEPNNGGFAIGDLTGDLTTKFTVSGTAADKLGFGPGNNEPAEVTYTGLRSTQVFFQGVNGLREKADRDANGLITSSLGGVDITVGGTTHTLDLSNIGADDSMNDMLEELNQQAAAAGLAVEFKLNNAQNGIEVVNNSGADVTFANTAGSTTANDLGLSSLNLSSGGSGNAGDLDTQWIHRGTQLSTLNGGRTFSGGAISLTNSLGGSTEISLAGCETIGDVLRTINEANAGVTATINDTGDGIRLTDDSGGEGNVTVNEAEGGSVASMLGILGSSEGSIDGSFEKTVEIDDNDSLRDVMNKLAYAGLDVQVSVINDGSDYAPYRLVVASQDTGSDNDLLLDTDIGVFNFTKTSSARDSVLLYGQGESGVSPVMMTDPTNSNNSSILGLTIDMHQTSDEWVTLSVNQKKEDAVAAIEMVVEAYNTMLDLVDQFDDFDADTGEGGLFFADSNIRNLLDDLTDSFFSVTETNYSGMSMWYDLGVKFNDDGQLDIDSSILNEKIANDFDAVRDLVVESIDVARKDMGASASTTDAGVFDPQNAINGNNDQSEFNTGNGFESLNPIGEGGYEYTVDFGKVRTIDRLSIFHPDTAEMPAADYALKSYIVEYLDASTNKWTELRTVSNNKGSENYLGFQKPTAVRGIRITGTESNAADGKFRLSEIEAYEPQGLGAQQELTVNRLTDSIDGWFATIQQSLTDQIDSIDDNIERLESRLEDVELRYIRQYTNMETSLANIQSQADYFSQQAASWSNSK